MICEGAEQRSRERHRSWRGNYIARSLAQKRRSGMEMSKEVSSFRFRVSGSPTSALSRKFPDAAMAVPRQAAPSLRSGFRLRAQPPATRLNFDSPAGAGSLRMTALREISENAQARTPPPHRAQKRRASGTPGLCHTSKSEASSFEFQVSGFEFENELRRRLTRINTDPKQQQTAKAEQRKTQRTRRKALRETKSWPDRCFAYFVLP